MDHPTLANIQEAHKLIKTFIHKTPILTSELLNRTMECKLYFKCENMQKAGAFKYRGATHAILKLSNVEQKRGVATHSSGNHAGALAKAANLNGISAFIVMPENAPKVKIEAVKAYGGEITFCKPTLQAREEMLQKVIERTGAVFVHPYDNFNVVCGQGTTVLEIAEQMEQPDMVMTPVGGGGLFSGTAIASKSIFPKVKVMGAEPFNASDAYQSFTQKKLIPVNSPNTIADGLLTSLSPFTFSIISEYADAILTCREESIIQSMELIYKYLKIVVEPSSAVPLACIIENRGLFRDKKVAIILSGGNVDLAKLPFKR